MSIALKFCYWYKPMSCSVTHYELNKFHGRIDQFFICANVAANVRRPGKILSSSNSQKTNEYICTILANHLQLYILLNNCTEYCNKDYRADTTFLNHVE